MIISEIKRLIAKMLHVNHVVTLDISKSAYKEMLSYMNNTVVTYGDTLTFYGKGPDKLIIKIRD